MSSLTFPITRNLSRAYTLSLIVALLTVLASLVGIVFQSAIYPTQALRQSFVPNDVVNLFIGLPILLGSMWFARGGKLIGLLFLPGALFYFVYNYIAYLVAMPVNALSVVYLALVVLSAIAMIQVLMSIDAIMVQRRLSGAVPSRLGGGVLLGFGLLFLFRAIGVIINSRTLSTEFAVAVADLIITPAWIVSGILLWRRHPIGYVTGLGLLFQASMLFIALIIFFLLQPFLTAVPFAFADAIVIFIMGMICFVPFGLFVRGVMEER